MDVDEHIINVENNILNLFIGTWNLAAIDNMSSNERLLDWLNPNAKLDPNAPPADMYVIGLQEIVELNTTNIIFSKSNRDNVELYKRIIIKNLNKIYEK